MDLLPGRNTGNVQWFSNHLITELKKSSTDFVDTDLLYDRNNGFIIIQNYKYH